MRKQITIEVDIPEGYEATGEFRNPRSGEPFIYSLGNQLKFADSGEYCAEYIILRKMPPRIRPYTPVEAAAHLNRLFMAPDNYLAPLIVVRAYGLGTDGWTATYEAFANNCRWNDTGEPCGVEVRE